LKPLLLAGVQAGVFADSGFYGFIEKIDRWIGADAAAGRQ
jgi:hypothetical protein